MRWFAGRGGATLGVLGSLGFALLFVTVVPSVGAATPATPVVVEITGYDRVSLLGETGPVVVVAKGKHAQAIRAALAGLAPATSRPECVENEIGFKVSLLHHSGEEPTYEATEQDCPTPGVVTVRVGGRITQQLQEDCALRTAVVAALPRGRAEGTRRDSARCAS